MNYDNPVCPICGARQPLEYDDVFGAPFRRAEVQIAVHRLERMIRRLDDIEGELDWMVTAAGTGAV